MWLRSIGIGRSLLACSAPQSPNGTGGSSLEASRFRRARPRWATLRYFSGDQRPAAGVRELMRQNQPLIAAQRPCRVREEPQVVSHQHERLRTGARIRNRRLMPIGPFERQRGGQRGLHRAASCQRTPQVTNPRQVAQLERVAEMGRVRERPSAACVRQQLQGGLAVTILQILPAQQMTVGAQQHLALGVRDARDLLERLRPSALALRRHVDCADTSRGRTSGRHIGMSSSTSSSPPSQFAPGRLAARGSERWSPR